MASEKISRDTVENDKNDMGSYQYYQKKAEKEAEDLSGFDNRKWYYLDFMR